MAYLGVFRFGVHLLLFHRFLFLNGSLREMALAQVAPLMLMSASIELNVNVGALHFIFDWPVLESENGYEVFLLIFFFPASS